MFVPNHCKYPVDKVSTFFVARSASTGVSVSMSNMYVGHLPNREGAADRRRIVTKRNTIINLCYNDAWYRPEEV